MKAHRGEVEAVVTSAQVGSTWAGLGTLDGVGGVKKVLFGARGFEGF